MMTVPTTGVTVRLSDVMAALATELSMGQLVDKALTTCAVTIRLGGRLVSCQRKWDTVVT